jgi:ABC-type transport system involved in cytochrome bd biosynthesis fused ATPase/permease subunit
MPDYSDVQKAVNTEKRRVWFAWLAASLLILLIAHALTLIGPVAAVIAEVLGSLLFLALTVTAYRMHTALNRRADRERRTVLGDDYPG